MAPLGVMRPISSPWNPVHHRVPAGPAVMPKGSQPLVDPQLVGRGNSVTLPAVVMRPILFPWNSANQRLPSGLAVMPLFAGVEMGNSVMVPAVVMRPMLLVSWVNQRLPSGPAVMNSGVPEGTGNSVMVPALAQAGAVLRLSRPTQTSVAVSRAVKCDRHPELFMFLPPLASVVNCATHEYHVSVFSSLHQCGVWVACCARKASPGATSLQLPGWRGVHSQQGDCLS